METQVLNIRVQCVPPTNFSTFNVGPDYTWNFTASLSPNCSNTFSGQEQNYPGWIGSMGTADPACAPLIDSIAPSTTNLTAPMYPVAIGFSANRTVGSAVFCGGYQMVYNTTATFDIRAGRISELSNLRYIPGHSLERFVLNGLVPDVKFASLNSDVVDS